jgi:diguanylate cyclase (GGDEF)-like protein
MSEQDDLTTLGILRSTRAFDNINIEILHLIILLNSPNRDNPNLLEEQLNVLESHFTIVVRQKCLDSLPKELRLRALDLIIEWNNLFPLIKKLRSQQFSQVDFVLRRLHSIHRRLTDLILQNQHLRFQQYEIISDARRHIIRLFIQVFFLFLMIIGLMVYLAIQFIEERQQILNERMKLAEELQNKNNILERMAMVDELTQIANRRYFNLVLDREWWRLLREQQPLSIILGDIDCFKLYNDYYGHQKGDECLRQVAQIIQEYLQRSSDIVARYGGEEFIILLPNTPLEGAIEVVTKIQKGLHYRHLPHFKSTVTDCVTLSLGIAATIPHVNLTPEILIDQADQALYLSKKAGRNQYQWVELYPPPSPNIL